MRVRSPSTPPRNFMQQGEQRKLLALVLLLGLAFFSIQAIGQPRSWAWFTYLTNPTVEQPVNTRLAERPLPMTAPGDVLLLAQNDSRNLNAPPALVTGDDAPAAGAHIAARRLFPGITPELLAPIRHDAPFSASDHRPFFTMFNILNTTPPTELAPFVRQDIPYVQLYTQPQSYCGELIHVKGLLRTAFSDLKAAPNEFGIKTYSQLWISPLDRSKHEVFSVYCLDLPAEVPRGETPKGTPPGEIELTGFYFKRWAYRAKDENLRSTPLILAQTVSWRPAPPPVEPAVIAPEKIAQDVTLAIVAALAICGAVVWYVMRRRESSPHERQLKALASRRHSGRGALEDLRAREVSPEVLAALGRPAPPAAPRADPS